LVLCGWIQERNLLLSRWKIWKESFKVQTKNIEFKKELKISITQNEEVVVNMDSKIRFSVPNRNIVFNIVINLFRPELEMKLDKMAFSMPKEFQNVRFGIIEKDRTTEEVEKFLITLGAKKISKLKILGLICCELETQNLEKLAERSDVKFIDLNESSFGTLGCWT
jgi:hypothetical protein